MAKSAPLLPGFWPSQKPPVQKNKSRLLGRTPRHALPVAVVALALAVFLLSVAVPNMLVPKLDFSPRALAAEADSSGRTPTPIPAKSGKPGWNTANGAVVLMYHRFGEGKYPSTNIKLSQLEAHIQALQNGGHTVLPLRRIVRAILKDEPLPPLALAITIDDAYRSIYKHAWPRLKAAGMPFTVFVATQGVDRKYRDFLSWAQMREMAVGGGVDFQPHTMSHPHLPDLPAHVVKAELAHARTRLREELGTTPLGREGNWPDLFAYPYGEYSLGVMAAVKDAGYAAAFGQHSGVIGRPVERLPLHRYALPRFAINEQYGGPERFRLVSRALPLPVMNARPREMTLRPENNPPRLSFSLAESTGDLARLSCYGTGRGKLKTIQLMPGGGPGTISVLMEKALPPGRWRINCTLPAAKGRWYWHGVQFYVPRP